jgi:hypothetical protein
MKPKFVTVNNLAQAKAAVRFLFALGYKANTEAEEDYIKRLETADNIDDYPCVGLSEDLVIHRRSNIPRYGESVDWITFMNQNPAPKVFEVRLNAEYTAKVSKDGIRAGCQMFPLSIIDDLVEARIQALKE